MTCQTLELVLVRSHGWKMMEALGDGKTINQSIVNSNDGYPLIF
jgi:hypothetical protein